MIHGLGFAAVCHLIWVQYVQSDLGTKWSKTWPLEAMLVLALQQHRKQSYGEFNDEEKPHAS